MATAMEIGHAFSHECIKVILTKREKIMLLRKHSSSIISPKLFRLHWRYHLCELQSFQIHIQTNTIYETIKNAQT